MILADTNIWLALSLSKHEFHSAARDWFASQRRPSSIALCRSVQQSFLRLLTSQSVMGVYDVPPLSNANAWYVMSGLFADGRVVVALVPENIEPLWKALATRRSVSPKLWMDAYLAAFAMAGRHQLITTDKAFSQFKDLNPIILSNRTNSN